jgi:C4-dicarboxylate-specific signal transduction histidine kinase
MVGPPFPRRAFYQTAVATGEATHEFSLRRPDGRTARLLMHVRLLERHADGSSDIVGYTRDVTAEREATARAMNASRLASLGEMATALAHELRQPLAVMSFAAENAVADLAAHDQEAARKRLERIVDQSLRAGAVIDHLQQFGRGDQPDAPLEAIDLQAAVTNALALVGGTLRHTDIEVVIAVEEPSPLVQAQLVSLEQVLVNLLLNARDALATRPPNHEKWIRLTATKDADTVRLEVADSGGGIAPEIIDRVFEPFVTTKPPGQGTGLGLSLSHGTMRSFGGSISVRNGPAGAVFTLVFQAASEEEARPGALPLDPAKGQVPWIP